MVKRSVKNFVRRALFCLSKTFDVKNFQRTIKTFQRASKKQKIRSAYEIFYATCKQHFMRYNATTIITKR